jgi:hypothetical protein
MSTDVITAILDVEEQKDLRCISARVRGRGRLAAHVERDVPIPSAPATDAEQASLGDKSMRMGASVRLLERVRSPP